MATVFGPPSPLPYPDDDPQSWNTLTIDGELVPGVIDFPKLRKGRKIDEKGTPGTDGATLTDKGTNLADLEIKIRLFKSEQFPRFYDIFKRKFAADRPLDKRQVATVVHPGLFLAGITRAYFFEHDSIQPEGTAGVYTINLKAKEFGPKVKIGSATKTPKPAVDFRSIKSAYTKAALARSQGQQSPADAVRAVRDGYAADAASIAPGMRDVSSTPAEMNRTYADRLKDSDPEGDLPAEGFESMTEATINGYPLVSGSLVLPWEGRWHGDFVVDADALTGPVTMVLLGTTYAGFVMRSGVIGGRLTARIIGGNGGLDKELQPKNWINGVTVGALLSETLGQVSEGLSSSSSPSLTGLLLPRWTRVRGPAGEEVARIASRAGGELRQLPDGSLCVCVDTWPAVFPAYDLIDVLPTERRLIISAEAIDIRPGMVLDGRRIIEVEHQVSPGQARTHLWWEETT